MLKFGVLLGATLVLAFSQPGSAADKKPGANADLCSKTDCQTKHGAVEFSSVELPSPPKSGEIEEMVLALLEESGPARPEPARHREMSPEEAEKWRERREQREQNIQMLQLWKIMQETELRKDQMDRFIPLIREYQGKERELADKRHQIVRALRSELRKDNPDKGQLNKLSNEMIQVSSEIVKVKHEGMSRIMELLDPGQKAKFVLSVSDIERDLWDAISRARHFGSEISPVSIDREKMRERMEQVREQVEKIKKELREKGYPVEPEKK